MKLRLGFVSNSSSSSFVLVGKSLKGQLVPAGYDDWYEFLEEYDIDYQYDENSSTMYTGKMITRLSGDEYGVNELDLTNLVALQEQVAKLPLPDVPVKIYFGTVHN